MTDDRHDRLDQGPDPTVGDLDEDTLLKRLRPLLPTDARVVVGAGDDCAVLRTGDPTNLLLLKTDAVVEGLHFDPSENPDRVGWKALARALSDVAAMGGCPFAALVTLGVDHTRTVDQVEGWYRGIRRVAEEFSTVVVGGETVGSNQGAWLSISLLGQVHPDQLRLRSGGRPGDELFVTGTLGGTLEGWHLDFIPRIEQGQWLAHRPCVHAMMDLSDGLARDLPRLAAASDCGFDIGPDKLPLRGSASTAEALTDGEDHELLLAVDPDEGSLLRQQWAAAFPDLPLTSIGHLRDASHGCRGLGEGGGWDHLEKR